MSETERLVEVELLGNQYRFYTGASEEEMQAILDLVRPLMEVGQEANVGTLATGKKAVMACLNIASRYVKLQQDFTDYKQNSNNRIARINDEISRNLFSE